MMTEGVLGRGSVNTGVVEYVFRRPVRSWRDGRQIMNLHWGKQCPVIFQACLMRLRKALGGVCLSRRSCRFL
ncbi:hypothetical protein [uncultured Bacteroides sp.]|uniref:hypothetical protein n=1 Tax=uncultured Bacteroides sp. TaxID=162156 RepID=UPI00280B09D0|nr:hypothetical protein [uncultured Bacteroides sp.]